MILSVSRRTDIPAFYSDWFFERLKDGFVLVPNPKITQKIAKIELKPAKIAQISQNLLGEKKIEMTGNLEGIVFWTKNPTSMMNRLSELGDIKYYFLYTLNAYPSSIEAGLPPLEKRIQTFKELSKICPVIWRYDPILLADGIEIEWHKRQFKFLCENLKGHTKHCKISFLITSYSGCAKNLFCPNLSQKNEILKKLKEVKEDYEN